MSYRKEEQERRNTDILVWKMSISMVIYLKRAQALLEPSELYGSAAFL